MHRVMKFITTALCLLVLCAIGSPRIALGAEPVHDAALVPAAVPHARALALASGDVMVSAHMVAMAKKTETEKPMENVTRSVQATPDGTLVAQVEPTATAETAPTVEATPPTVAAPQPDSVAEVAIDIKVDAAVARTALEPTADEIGEIEQLAVLPNGIAKTDVDENGEAHLYLEPGGRLHVHLSSGRVVTHS